MVAVALLVVALALTLDGLGRWLAAGGGAALAAAAAWAALEARRRERRLVRLAAVGQALAAGRPATPSGESADDALGRLGRALDDLSRRLAGTGRPPTVGDAGLHDPLTGLPNRRLFQELLGKQIAQARRSGELLGLVLCDLDDLQGINESYGHEFGDRLLQAVGQRLSGDIREADSIARTGEDEFTLLLGRAQAAEDIHQVAERLMAGFRKPFEVGDAQIAIAASIGVSLFPRDAADGDRLIDAAEAALAAAKRQGGSAVRAYSTSMEQGRRRRGVLAQELRVALRDDQLCLYFQPQISLTDGRLVGSEALVRWRHPERGLIPAGGFIPAAEAAGLMPELGRWLMREVCRQNAAWRAAGARRLPVSVNVSGRQFQSGDVAEVVEEALEASGLEPDGLQLEITESIALGNFERISATLFRLQADGVKIHLDDFGTGYSSLSYLLRFPVDVLKIDRSFVAGVPASRHGASIVRATLSLARSLGLAVVAEGVEEPEQLRFLQAEGCAAVQGYLLGRPAPVREFERLMADGGVDLAALLTA